MSEQFVYTKAMHAAKWASTPSYRSNYDAIFRSDKDANSQSEKCVPCTDQPSIVDTEHCTNDLIRSECRHCIIQSGNESLRDGDPEK